MDHKQFITAGNATFTAQNAITSTRYTYKVSAPTKTTPNGGLTKDYDAGVRFVKVLTGSDNYSDYKFIGTIFLDNMAYRGKRGMTPPPSGHFFSELFNESISRGKCPEHIEINHAGKCARCGRKLTVPESIKSGFGPECITKI